jgi:hypothetical protein
LNGPIEIVRTVVAAIQSRNLQGYNFNRYYDPQHGVTKPRIDLRFRVSDADEVLEPVRRCLREFVSAGRIVSFSNEPRTWIEPDFVFEAHEMATRCAILFVDEVTHNQVLLHALADNNGEFMLHFLRRLFELIGVESYVAWTYLRRPAPEGLEEVVQRCAGPLGDSFRHQTRRADYLERFVHLFLNCTVNRVEQWLLNSLLASMLWRRLAEGLD